MSCWKVKSSTLWILSIVVLFMLVIVVLPEVDLPDTAFHRGTAPLVVHAKAKTAPPIVAVAALFQVPDTAQFWTADRDPEIVATNLEPNFRPIFLRSIRR